MVQHLAEGAAVIQHALVLAVLVNLKSGPFLFSKQGDARLFTTGSFSKITDLAKKFGLLFPRHVLILTNTE
jgi:hypothetical protein